MPLVHESDGLPEFTPAPSLLERCEQTFTFRNAAPDPRCWIRACPYTLSSDSGAAGRLTRARIRSRGSKPRNPPLLRLNCKTLPQYCTIWRKCGWCMNACPWCQRMRLRCPQSHPSCTRSSLGPCTPCGTNPCNLVYIGCDAYADLRPRGPLRSPGTSFDVGVAARHRLSRSEQARGPFWRQSEC